MAQNTRTEHCSTLFLCNLEVGAKIALQIAAAAAAALQCMHTDTLTLRPVDSAVQAAVDGWERLSIGCR